MPEPDHLPCPDCGASLTHDERDDHVCDEERRLDYQLTQLRDGIDGFETRLAEWLDSPDGRFARWRAEHEQG